MDDILKVEFPLGPRTVVMTRPGDGQLFAITVMRKPKDGDPVTVKHRFTERVVRFLEALAGPEQWAGIEDDMLSGSVAPLDLMELFSEVLQFDWDAYKEQRTEPDPGPDPVRSAVEKRAPRVVSGG